MWPLALGPRPPLLATSPSSQGGCAPNAWQPAVGGPRTANGGEAPHSRRLVLRTEARPRPASVGRAPPASAVRRVPRSGAAAAPGAGLAGNAALGLLVTRPRALRGRAAAEGCTRRLAAPPPRVAGQQPIRGHGVPQGPERGAERRRDEAERAVGAAAAAGAGPDRPPGAGRGARGGR